jgi:hypothetical protein
MAALAESKSLLSRNPASRKALRRPALTDKSASRDAGRFFSCFPASLIESLGKSRAPAEGKPASAAQTSSFAFFSPFAGNLSIV